MGTENGSCGQKKGGNGRQQKHFNRGGTWLPPPSKQCRAKKQRRECFHFNPFFLQARPLEPQSPNERNKLFCPSPLNNSGRELIVRASRPIVAIILLFTCTTFLRSHDHRTVRVFFKFFLPDNCRKKPRYFLPNLLGNRQMFFLFRTMPPCSNSRDNFGFASPPPFLSARRLFLVYVWEKGR